MRRRREPVKNVATRDVGMSVRPFLLGALLESYASRGLWDLEQIPRLAARAKGPYVWGADGRRYVDFMLAFGCVILGHADRRVDRAVRRELRSGVAASLYSDLSSRLAELLYQLVPNAEKALFLRTGSDATGAAVRLARAYTGRAAVIRWGYNGWHEWCAPSQLGLGPHVQDHVFGLEYDNYDSIEKLMRQHDGGTACVIMMPYETAIPSPGFLGAVRDLAHSHGALFILDEVRTGFRLGLGGAQGYFNVDADLVTFSKAMGNGYPISVVTGRSEILDRLSDISVTSPFYRARDGLAAALATIEEIRSRRVIDVIWQRGRELMNGLTSAARIAGAPVEVIGLSPAPFHRFLYPTEELNSLARTLFTATAAAHGALFCADRHWYVCASMTTHDVRAGIAAAHEGYQAVVRHLGPAEGPAGSSETVSNSR